MKKIKVIAVIRKTYDVDDNVSRAEVEKMFCEESVGSVLVDFLSGEAKDEDI